MCERELTVIKVAHARTVAHFVMVRTKKSEKEKEKDGLEVVTKRKHTHKERGKEMKDTPCAGKNKERKEREPRRTHDFYLRNLMRESRAKESACVKASSVWEGSPRLVPSGERMVAR